MSIRFLKATGSRLRKRSNPFHLESLEDRRLLAGDLVAQWSADDLSLDDGAVVESWVDSVSTIEAVRQNGDPTFLASGYGGRGFIQFDATDASENLRIRTNDSPLNGAADFSVTVAFTTSAEASGGNGNWFDNVGIVDANTSGFSSGWGLSINAAGQLGTGLGGGFGQPIDNVYSSESGLNDGILHVATVTRSGGDLSIYVDDGAPTSLAGGNSGPRSGVDLAIGATLNSFNGFTGGVGELRIYDGQLSAAEVTTLHAEINAYYNNETPLAVDDSYNLNEDQFFFVTPGDGVLANDTDAEGDALSVELGVGPSNGTLSLQPDGSFVYTPRADYFGIDLFTYSVSDTRAGNRLGVVTLNIAPTYDAASGVADNYKTQPNSTLNIPALVGVLANDSNIDQAALTAVLADDVANGQLTLNADGSFSYSPQGFSGEASFTYRVDDGTGQSDPATVSIVVNTPPETVADTYSVDEDNSLQVSVANGVLANDVDADGNSLTAELVSDVSNGTLAFNDDGSFTYSPSAEYSGPDSFSYRITDGIDGSVSDGIVSILVETVNDPPTGNSDSYFALPGESLEVPAGLGVLANDTDVDGPALTASLLQSTQNGTLVFNGDGSFTYSPNVGFEGEDSFSYRVTDGSASSDVSVALQIVDRPVIISEIMTSNANTIETQLRSSAADDFEGETYSPDWIEIRNLFATPIDMTGLYLTDDDSDPTKWQFPAGTTVPADGYLVVFASGLDVNDPDLDSNGFLHTNFTLNTTGEYVAITGVGGAVVDAIDPGYPAQRTHITYGFDAGNPAIAGYFLDPTPGAANSEIRSAIVDDTKFSVERGFYNEPFTVEVTTATEDATIRYTTDGTDPSDSNGTTYTGPISISKTTNLRVIALKDGMVPTNIDTASYIFLSDVVEQDEQATLDAGFPERWRNARPDYGLDSEDQFPLIAGDTTLSVEEAKQAITESLQAIPSFSIAMDIDDMFGTQGIYANPTSRGERWERPASVEMLTNDGTEGFQIDAGIRIQGGAFRNFGLTNKKSFRLLFKTQYGPGKLNYPLFGPDATQSFDTLTLRMESNDGWQWGGASGQPQYARDQFLRNVQLAMGHNASHGRAIHLYINGFYWGLYNIVERPDQSFGEAYLGSEKYDWDGINTNGPTNADGDSYRRNRSNDAWREATTQSRAVRDAETKEEEIAALMKIQGMNPDGTNNPDYEAFIDMENMIDYFIINFYGDNSDWPRKNYYMGRENSPDSEGFQFFMWDAEWSLFMRSNIRGGSEEIRDARGIAAPLSNLRRTEEFQLMFADRIQKHFFNDGIFYVDPENPNDSRAAGMYQEWADQVYPALIAESARWGDQHRSRPYTRDVEWQREFDRIMTQWFPERTENMIRIYQQNELFPELMAARFSQRGGIVEAGTSVTLTSDSGKMYYTLDDSDPRVMGGAISDSAIEYTGPITVDDDVTVRVRVLDGEIWSAIDEAEYKVGVTFATADSLRISEVHYNPALPTQAERDAGFTDKDDFEFVEVVNVSNEVIDLSNAQLQQITIGADVHGVDFDFADGAITELAPGDRIVIVEDTAAFAMRYPNVTAVAGEWSGGLSNASETITLGDSAGVFQQFTYSDLWQPKTDGDGFSLELINPADANLDNWNVAESWQQSSEVGGSPAGTSGPVAGDSNHDGIFDSGDFVAVFQAGEYEDGIDGNSTFEEGDWNGDGDFSSADFVFVFQIGNYVAAAMPINRHSEFAGGRDDLAQLNVINREVSPDTPVQGNPSEPIELRPADAVDTIFGEWESPETIAEEHDLAEDDDLSKWDLLV